MRVTSSNETLQRTAVSVLVWFLGACGIHGPDIGGR